ncbi:glycosyltransferase family 39 protein, partial [bacterium]|nr:glycosyltransferase family 39 protein [bacterium]
MSENNTNQSKVHGWAEWPGWPYVLVGLAVILRLAHIYNSRTNPTFWAPAVDPAWYDEAAFNILRGQWGPFPLFRAPLYPALLAGMYGIFGHDLAAARILNVAVQGAAIWALWRVGRSYFAPAVGILAAALLAINGTAIYFAGEILSTSTELLAAVLGLWATLRLTRDVRPTAVFLCGLSWGLAAITRPNFLVCFPVVLAAIWFVQYRQLSATSRRLPTLALSFLVWFVAAFVPILPVTAANAIKGGEFVLIATQGGVNFWIGNNPESTGILSVLPGYGNTWTMEDAEFEAEHEAGRMLRPGELSSFYFTKGWKFLSAHPGLSIRFMIRKSLLFFNRFEISNNKHILYFAAKSPWLPPLLWLNMGILVPLAALGIWVGRRTFSVQLLAGLILLFMISVILFFVTARFRMPVVPWLSLVAASGLWWAWQRIAVRARAREFLPLLLLVPGIALAHMNLWNLTEAPLGWARYMEGNAYLQLDRLDSARAAFLDAYHDGQALSRTQLNLGVIAYRQGNYSEARRW